jgi:hypothetical protein
MKKLAIIIPYRDRKSHLEMFLPYMKKYLKEYDYKIYVIEQNDNKPFNRGKLLNIGAKIAIREGFDYLALHDVDMLPLKGVDYSYPDTPIHLAAIVNSEQPFDDYFGGVTLFNVEDFKIINGFSNEYWGWGFEDDDLLQRCIQKNVPLDTIKFGIPEKEFLINYFRFNGSTSHIKIPLKNLLTTFSGDFTISIKCKPEDCKINESADFDEYYITSIPGRNTGLSYTSFKRYKSELWTNDNKSTSIQSDIIGEIWSHLVMTKTDDTLSFYMNGKLIGTEQLNDQIFGYDNTYFYIGVGNPNSENDKFYFKGLISEFAIWNIALDKNNINEIYENSSVKSILNDYRRYNKSKYLKCYYDFKNFKNDILLDLSDNRNNAFIIECEDNYLINKFETEIPIPIRREGKFKTLKHNSNSTIGNKWIHYETRKNQTRFYNEMKGTILNLNIDGLNTCRYTQLETEQLDDLVIKIKVEL